MEMRIPASSEVQKFRARHPKSNLKPLFAMSMERNEDC